MNKQIMMVIVAASLMVGCAPKITTEMTTQALAPKATNQIMILGAKDTIPDEARAIGQIKINSRHSSLRKNYTKILNLAVKETAQQGGNILVVDHSDMEKNTLKGTMAYYEGETNSALTISPRRIKCLLAMGTQQNQSPIRAISKEQEQMVKQRQEEAAQQEMSKYSTLAEVEEQKDVQDTTIQESSFEDASDYFDIKEENEKRKGVIKISGGPMWTLSKMYLSYDGRGYFTGARGTAFDLSIHSIGDLWGYGFDLYGSQTNLSIGNYFKTSKESYNFIYAGPNLVMGGTFAQHFYADLSVGIGIGYYHDSGSDEVGFGMRESVGLGVMLNNHFSVGIDAAIQMATFKRPEGFNQPENEAYGFKCATVMLTLRTHL
ncbi:porin family protein [Prevotella sp. E13-17]|uniref:porin family protein n=1 Tax=Prevotella sp. E13-17 TaxID=2913616 RepID=UPI001EDAC21F|nr:porin family protein [Prevotella sp. E13-17]UKK50584.1 porin family protein [Prevotella sp. E13-17]